MLQSLFLGAAALVAACTIAGADHERYKWEGTIRIVSQTEFCNAQFASTENDRARYHPKLGESDPPSSFTRYMNGGETEMIELHFHFEDGEQFHGEGGFISHKIAGGVYTKDQSQGENFRLFNFTQTPAQLTSATPFVTLAGTLRNYQGMGSSCVLTLRGHFTRVDPDTD